jgi:hypothetical protein
LQQTVYEVANQHKAACPLSRAVSPCTAASHNQLRDKMYRGSILKNNINECG